MDLAEIIETVSERKQHIEQKYMRMMQKISELEDEIKGLEAKYRYNTKSFIDGKRSQIQIKINSMKSNAESWKGEQLKKVEDWLIERERSIKDTIMKQENELNKKREGFRLQNNEIE